MIGSVGEPARLVPVDPCSIWERVIRWAHVEVAWVAPRGNVWVYDHLTVPGDVGGDVSVAGLTVVLPAASDVHKVELAVGATASD